VLGIVRSAVLTLTWMSVTASTGLPVLLKRLKLVICIVIIYSCFALYGVQSKLYLDERMASTGLPILPKSTKLLISFVLES